VVLTLDPNAVLTARVVARQRGWSLSRYVDALLTGDVAHALRAHAAVKSGTALAVAPLAQLGTAAAGTIFAIRDAVRSGTPVPADLLERLDELAGLCHAVLRAVRRGYDDDLDAHMRFNVDDTWRGS
jgi:hypothetical protein